MASVKPGDRLLGACAFLKPGGRVADIGTDHAYLPIYLLEHHLSAFAVASDIHRGPIERAREHIRAAGLSDRIETLLTDGLHGIEDYHPDDILIFGMGGELIASILSDAGFVKNPDIGLILQPMSKAATLRAFLIGNGFSILDESLVFEDRCYQILYARYTGKVDSYTEEELLLGRRNIEKNAPLLTLLIEREMHILKDIIQGKKQSSEASFAEEESLLNTLQNRWEKINECT